VGVPPLSWNVQALPAGHSPPPQLASHGTPVGTQTQSLEIGPILNGAHVRPPGQLPPHVGKADPPLQGNAARQKHSPGKFVSMPQLYDTGHAPGQVAVGAPGMHALPGSTQAHSANVMPPLSAVAWHMRPSPHVPPQVGYCEPMQGVTPSGRHWQPMPGNSSSQHRAPGPQFPLQLGNVSPQGVGRLVVVVLVVVVVTTQPVAPQASQQLDADPTHACPPRRATHDAGACLTVHLVAPPGFVRQHVTAPGSPQVERDAQRRTAD